MGTPTERVPKPLKTKDLAPAGPGLRPHRNKDSEVYACNLTRTLYNTHMNTSEQIEEKYDNLLDSIYEIYGCMDSRFDRNKELDKALAIIREFVAIAHKSLEK